MSISNNAFVTDVNSIRNAVSTTVDGKPAVFVSGLTGDVGCYTLDGQKVWMQASQTPAVMSKL